ncbi:uncharacterized protein LOC133735352 [Rosa rugosa]|uniref:uncharacterized protein LOC133735352 n=1 Tax=Rosa rugosa TaxID=74645 RepID=UPI002B412B1B|nr:uncharacterized protein LOC133735352 [Rosa rugosa]
MTVHKHCSFNSKWRLDRVWEEAFNRPLCSPLSLLQSSPMLRPKNLKLNKSSNTPRNVAILPSWKAFLSISTLSIPLLKSTTSIPRLELRMKENTCGASFDSTMDYLIHRLLGLNDARRPQLLLKGSAGHLLDVCMKNVGLGDLKPCKGYHFPQGLRKLF